MRQLSGGTRERMRLTSIHPLETLATTNLSHVSPVLLLLAVFLDTLCLLHLYRFEAPACEHPYQDFSSPSRLWLFWGAEGSRATPMLSLMATLLMWAFLPRAKLCLFKLFWVSEVTKVGFLQEIFREGSSMSNLNLGSTPQLSEVYIFQLKAVTYKLPRDSDVNRYCPTFSLLGFIATRLPDFILRKISVVKKENDGFLTPTSLLSFTRGHLKLKWWCSLLLTMQHAGLWLSLNQEKLALNNVATDVCPALSYQSAPSWKEWPGCSVLETTLWFPQCLDHYLRNCS